MGQAIFKMLKKKGKDKMNDIPKSFWDLKANDIQGNEVAFSSLKGKKLFILVNVASACGLTNKNYRQLKKFHDKYEESGLHIMGFPCNQFRGQETQCDADIEETIKNKFKIKFQMMSKIEVNGQECHPVYKFLRANSELWNADSGTAQEIPWNFAKFLVNEEGEVVKFYSSEVAPKDFEGEMRVMLGLPAED